MTQSFLEYTAFLQEVIQTVLGFLVFGLEKDEVFVLQILPHYVISHFVFKIFLKSNA